MLTDHAEEAFVAMCENARKLKPKFMFRCKGIDRNTYEISAFYGFRLFKLF